MSKPSQTKSPSQVEFEKFASKRHLNLIQDTYGYVYGDTKLAWEAWQISRHELVNKTKDIEAALVFYTNENSLCFDTLDGQFCGEGKFDIFGTVAKHGLGALQLLKIALKSDKLM